VVLIDEIDKAPRDFPNDLLNEIDRLYFRVPELQNRGSPGVEPGEDGIATKFRPIVIMTSNSEKGLPDPFLRRCVYFDIPFPSEAEMEEIVSRRLVGLVAGGAMLRDAIDLFYSLRRGRRATSLKKEPSTAELINWLQILQARGAKPDERLNDKKDLVCETISTLVKNTDDRRDAQNYVVTTWKGAPDGTA